MDLWRWSAGARGKWNGGNAGGDQSSMHGESSAPYSNWIVKWCIAGLIFAYALEHENLPWHEKPEPMFRDGPTSGKTRQATPFEAYGGSDCDIRVDAGARDAAAREHVRRRQEESAEPE